MQIGEVPDQVRIMVVEDHLLVRQSLVHMLDLQSGFRVVVQAGTLEEAREVIEEVDVAVLDLALPDGNAIELIKDLHALKEDTMVLILSGSISSRQHARAVEAGAAGIMHKSASVEEIVQAIKRLNGRESLHSLEEVVELFRTVSQQREREQEAKQALQNLSEREKDLLWALAEGLDGEQIAQKLCITVATERSHFLRIFAKLGVHSRLQALILALRYGVVEIR